jgi:UDP-N-acetylmuramoyl-L-alanyl-D-glutamate--2,6-diaminopimelate ligase
MRLDALLGPDIAVEHMPADIVVDGVTADSRSVRPGYVFAGLAGSRADGARFVADAIAKGAAAVLVAQGTSVAVPATVAVLRSREPRRALALMAARFHSRQPPAIVAVTGTSGKTSIAEFSRQIFAALGRRAASLGTIGVVKPDGAIYGSLTTPDPVTLHSTLDALASEGVTHLAMEASSHGLDQFRLDGVRLAAAAFNNLGRDHLDYHSSMKAYLDAKLRLFRDLMQPGQPVVVNMDGDCSGEAAHVARLRGLEVLTTGTSGETLRLVSASRRGFAQALVVEHGGRRHEVELPLVGDYQAGNALVAAGLAMATGERAEAAIAALATLKGVAGRLEVVGRVAGAIAVVDYAHKPEALGAALDALSPFATGRLVCVFGCGGDRDRGKRPIMGRIAAEKAEVVIVTDDNPRSETPGTIRAEILAAAPGAREIGDRREAIRMAVAGLQPGDVLLVAGKGHETGQIVGDTVLPFSDQQEVLDAIRARGGNDGHG